MQKLTYPINQATLTAGYKGDCPNYSSLIAGQVHHGLDMVGSPQNFFASGEGYVLGFSKNAGNTVGKWLAILYCDAVYWEGGQQKSGALVARHFHLDDIFVNIDQKVGINTKVARYGNTGPFSKGAHLHVEIDRDTRYWNYTPTLSGSNGGLLPGYRDNRDTTLNPCDVFHAKLSAPENQRILLNTDKRFMKDRNILTME